MLARFAAALQRGQIQMGTMGEGGGTAVVMDDNCLVSYFKENAPQDGFFPCLTYRIETGMG
jgi:hypothetical protein